MSHLPLPAETQYFYTDDDSDGAQLEGAHQYAVTFPAGALPPVNGFWSPTLYDEHHLFALNGRLNLIVLPRMRWCLPKMRRHWH